jgi:hypothetical protein
MLKIKFWKIENMLCMKVLEQDENIFNVGFEYKSSNNIYIYSDVFPEIGKNSLFLQGTDKTKQNHVVSCEFSDSDEAQEHLDAYIFAINECISHFKEDREEETNTTCEEFVVGE